jgi:transposase
MICRTQSPDSRAARATEKNVPRSPNCNAISEVPPATPSTRSGEQPIPHDIALYRQRHRIETMFARLKDWRRIAMRYDRCAHTFFAAITLAAIVIFWLGQ